MSGRSRDSEILDAIVSLHAFTERGLQMLQAELRGEIGSLRYDMNKRFDRVDQRFDRLEERVARLEHGRA
jgi:hypothetical protein